MLMYARQYYGVCSPVNGEWSLVTGHVSVHVAGVHMVDHNVLPGVAVHHPLLDPAQSTEPYLGDHIGGVWPAVGGVCTLLCRPHKL